VYENRYGTRSKKVVTNCKDVIAHMILNIENEGERG
jgi:hypothetical protein